jgi:peptide/nickel transport system substrate-binding protein
MFGYTPALKPEPFDPDGAKKLLAEAGYPDGFGITLHGPNDRYVNDDQICQAIAQMLSRVGILTKIETLPSAIYFSRGTKLEFSFMLVGWASDTAEASSPLKSLLATYSKEKGMGPSNRGRYSNPKLDALLAKYADEGVLNLGDANVLKIAPFTAMGSVVQLIKAFGDRQGFEQAVHELQSALYQEAA